VGTVTLFGSGHPDAPKRLEDIGVPRLRGNQKLLRAVRSGMIGEWQKDPKTGFFQLRMGISIDSEQIEALSAMIARGLLWHYWRTILDPSQACVAFFLARNGQDYFDKLLALNTVKRVNLRLASGLFSCIGAASEADPHVSVWIFDYFGGINLTGDPQDRYAVASRVGALSGTRTSLKPELFGTTWG
jgi:hypothetical protein